MKRLLLGISLLASCGGTGEIATAERPLTHYPCGGAPINAVDVSYSDGACIKYFVPANADHSAITLINDHPGAYIEFVHTFPGAAAWVCSASIPRGVTDAKYAPCWEGSVNNGVQRVRGVLTNGRPGEAWSTITLSARSLVVSLGTLPPPPACAYNIAPAPQNRPPHWHQILSSHDADDGYDAYTANYDPSDSTTCCNVSGPWPDGTPSGAPCGVNDSPTGYAEVYYGPSGF